MNVKTVIEFVRPLSATLTYTKHVNLKVKDRIENDSSEYEARSIKNPVDVDGDFIQTIRCSGSGLN